MRVVFDTNVILSAFLWQKNLKIIYDAIRDGKVTPCFNVETWAELHRTLGYTKFERQLAAIGVTSGDIIQLLTPRSYFATATIRVDAIKDDPSDNFVLACALGARAFYIVSGDAHLLKVGVFQDIPIVAPKEFIAKL